MPTYKYFYYITSTFVDYTLNAVDLDGIVTLDL